MRVDLQKSGPPRAPEDSAVAWFVVLERARITGDYELAAQAAGELRRLGVRVKFAPRPANGNVKGGAHVG